VWHVTPGAPPYLLVHGDFDFMVSGEQTEAMQGALEAAGNPVRFLLLFDAGHALTAGADVGGLYYGTARDRPELWIALIDFLYESLGAP
jgi:dipeptidyl aminopeptidase/acylaminoacyl peptidase